MRLRSAAALLLAALCLSGCGAWEAPEGWTALAMARETAGEYAPDWGQYAGLCSGGDCVLLQGGKLC